MNEIDIDVSEIFSDGCVRIYRQRTDLTFSPDNILNIERDFASPSQLHSAFSDAMKKEAEIAAHHPLAWNPEFGYVTARPNICGTGLEISALFHLEGLHLIGDLDPSLNALYGLRLSALGYAGGGMKDAAHLFRIANCRYLGIDERDLTVRIGRVFSDLVQQETNARVRLVEELPRVLEDAISRSIAILRSCRLLSEWELLDIVSPLRIAAGLDFLENFTREEAHALMRSRLNIADTQQTYTYEEQRERDRRDAALANKVNRRFSNVRLNARGKDYLS